MFIAGVVIEDNDEEKLRSIGVKDSKLLTPQTRAKLFTLICMYAHSIIVSRVPPKVIDRSNLNNLFIKAVNNIIESVFINLMLRDVREIVIDATSGSTKLIKEVRRLLHKLGVSNVDLIVENKADLKYTVVSAASIVAKYLRDSHINVLHEVYGDFGSGYSSDPKTREWLLRLNVNEIPPIVRRSWSTLKKLGIGYISKEQTLLRWARSSKEN